MEKLSIAAQRLWAKKSQDGNLYWLPLVMHMADSAALAKILWNQWLSDGVKQTIAAGFVDEDSTEQLFVFLSAAHDIGKAIPAFQAKNAVFPRNNLDESIEEGLINAGMPMRHERDFANASKTPHALATQILLEQHMCSRNVAVILGAHHGKPPSSDMLNKCGTGSFGENYHLAKEGEKSWTAIQRELITFSLGLADLLAFEELPRPNMAAQTLLSGLVIMTDWIASNEEYFPYIHHNDAPDYRSAKIRAAAAYEQLALPAPWTPANVWMHSDLYHSHFDFDPNAVQTAVAQVAGSVHVPGILVLEAPMGVGKTEAALVAAEIFAYTAKRTGLFFALPTQATSDGIFSRLLQWIENLDDGVHSVRLAHGKAQFNSRYQTLKLFEGSTNVGADEADSSAFVHDWFEGQKKSLLADFVVGTIDQLLLAALKQKHVMLRHLGLANKVVVIDECHAYDAYMSRYLERSLRWLGAYHVPVIVLSATLPAQKRQLVIDAYLNINSTPKPPSDPLGRITSPLARTPDWVTSRAYPLVTYSDGSEVKQKVVLINDPRTEVSLDYLPQDALLDQLDYLLSGGGCAGLIVNTVERAQILAQMLCERFGSEAVQLLHSRFLAPDRSEKEMVMLSKLGKPGFGTNRPQKYIVIGTQVLEQSLDIDFDVLITDFCPMDLLLQRIGRLHRHKRTRPEKLNQAFCLIMGLDGNDFEAGAKIIYGEFLLMRTRARLPKQITLPQDIPTLVQDVYDDTKDLCPEPPTYHEVKKRWEYLISDKEKRADTFRICPPWSDSKTNLVDWLNTDVPASEKHGEAAVRDSDESFEVLLIQQKEGKLYFLPWREKGRELLANVIPDDELAQALARQSIRLPRIICTPWAINRTIEELEYVNRERLKKWQESPWLRGDLFFILDEQCSACLNGYRLTYDQDLGLLYEEDGTNERR